MLHMVLEGQESSLFRLAGGGWLVLKKNIVSCSVVCG
jgi:hypothetical protein